MSPAAGAAVQKARSLLQGSDSVVGFTGAGVSTASGVPDFRSEDGLWSRFDPEEFRYERFLNDPAGFWELRAELTRELGLDTVEPNACHDAFADAYEGNRLEAVITQNIDGLHQQAGVPTEDVLEVHGSTRRTRCVDCGDRALIEEALVKVDADALPPTCDGCGGVLKPDVVLFGERLPQAVYRRAESLARSADAMVVAGSSLSVHPAAGLPERTLEAGGRIVIVNQESTPLDARADAVVHGRVETVVPELLGTP